MTRQTVSVSYPTSPTERKRHTAAVRPAFLAGRPGRTVFFPRAGTTTSWSIGIVGIRSRRYRSLISYVEWPRRFSIGRAPGHQRTASHWLGRGWCCRGSCAARLYVKGLGLAACGAHRANLVAPPSWSCLCIPSLCAPSVRPHGPRWPLNLAARQRYNHGQCMSTGTPKAARPLSSLGHFACRPRLAGLTMPNNLLEPFPAGLFCNGPSGRQPATIDWAFPCR